MRGARLGRPLWLAAEGVHDVLGVELPVVEVSREEVRCRHAYNLNSEEPPTTASKTLRPVTRSLQSKS